jgi:hypothetical protein
VPSDPNVPGDPHAAASPALPAVIVMVSGAIFLIFWGVAVDVVVDVARIWLTSQAAQ